jgi:tetratricopeptide (TPR) repeat protein
MPRFCSRLATLISGIAVVISATSELRAQAAQKQSAQVILNQHYQAARTFSIAGDTDKAASEYRAFLGEALHQMAVARVNEGRVADAFELFDAAITATLDDVQLRLDYGNALFQQNQMQKAKAQAEQAIKLQPNNAQAQYLLGRVFFELGDYKSSKEHLEDAVKAAGGDITFDVGYDLAITYLKLKDLNRARLLFDEMMIGLGNTAQIHVYFGHAYLMTDHFDQAISEFKEALRKDPKIKEAHYFLGLAYLSRDEDNGWDENAAEDRAEIENNPDDFRPHFDLGNIDLKRHNTEEAERELRRSSEIEPDNPDPLIALGELLISERKLPEAKDVMSRAIAATKDISRDGYQVSRAYYVLGRAQMETGDREEGIKNLKTAAELREKSQAPPSTRDATAAVAQQRRASEQVIPPQPVPSRLSPEQERQIDAYFEGLKPAIADAYNNLGVAAASHKDYTTALLYFQKAGEWYPTLQTLDRNIGMAAFYSGNYQAAITPLFRVLEQNPDDQRARTALGLSYFAVENYQATLETFRPIEKVVADDPGAGSAYAVSLVKTGQYEDGMSRLKKLEQANPGTPGLHASIGQIYADQGIYATAIAEYKQALALDSSQSHTHFLLGVALLRDGKPADAVPEFRAALNSAPADSLVRYDLGLALLQTQQKDEALPLFQQVIKQDPKYADAYYQLGKLELESGDTKQSISDLEAAANLSPTSDYIHYQLSLAYGRDSRRDDAKREMETYQALKTQRRGDHEQPRSN